MRLAIAALLLATGPAFAEDKPLLERDCMEAVGTMAYGPATYGNGVLVGIAMGYAIAHGMSDADAKDVGRLIARECRNTPGMTFGEALATLH